MEEFIERDTAAAFAYNCGAIYVSNRLSNKSAFPAADVELVRHGRWEWDTEDIYRCSNCAEKSHVKEVMGHPEWDYCPNCGAKMDGCDGNSAMA